MIEGSQQLVRAPRNRSLHNDIEHFSSFQMPQQPEWGDEWLVEQVRDDIANLPGLVDQAEVAHLRSQLARVARGELQVIQAGDCAEDPAECAPAMVHRKVRLISMIANGMQRTAGKPVMRVGRVAGQFGKPRTKSTEQRGDVTLPAFRGLIVNGPEFEPSARTPDPLRMLDGYHAAAEVTEYLRTDSLYPRVWTSHEALVLDYEIPQLRRDAAGRVLLASTHWPWVGERTRAVGGAHVELLASVINPVACKVGPTIDTDELVALCAKLDPYREAGRLTLIARLGADVARERLPGLVAAVRSAGHPVIWMCDPMHANTITAPNGRKTRLVREIRREITAFQGAVASVGAVPGGLHLEVTPHHVDECVTDHRHLHHVGQLGYRTLCDPRLNPSQALATTVDWASPATERR